MTISPTHLSISGIVFWALLSPQERERFQHAKGIFWLILAFSILPDFDVFLGQHRGFSHSILPPLLLMIMGSFLHGYFQYYGIGRHEETQREKYAFWGRCMLYIGGLWLFHIALDWEWPLTLFYPLSDRAYRINFEYVLNLVPWLVFPAMIVGIGLKITGISYLQGLSTYFINLPPSVRQQIFGGPTAAFLVPDFVLHVTLFSIFLVHVARPMMPKVDFHRLKIKGPSFDYDKVLLGSGLILILSGAMFGPLIGLQTTDSSSISGTLSVSPSVFSPTIALSFESTKYLFQPSTTLYVDGLLNITSSNPLNRSLLLTDPSIYHAFTENVSQIFSDYTLNSSLNEQMFRIRYQSFLSSLYSRSYTKTASFGQKISRVNLDLATGPYVLLGVLTGWNSSQVLNGTSQQTDVRLEVVFSTSRFTLYMVGIIFMIVGLSVSILSFRLKKKQG